MSLLDLNLVFWDQMLMISLDHNTHTYICTTARSATQLPRAVTGINGNMALINLGFYTH